MKKEFKLLTNSMPMMEAGVLKYSISDTFVEAYAYLLKRFFILKNYLAILTLSFIFYVK